MSTATRTESDTVLLGAVHEAVRRIQTESQQNKVFLNADARRIIKDICVRTMAPLPAPLAGLAPAGLDFVLYHDQVEKILTGLRDFGRTLT